jgi:pyruvate,water dikinase
MVRAFWVMRAFVLRAGELTSSGDGLFFLPIDDVLRVLGGETSLLERVHGQRQAYERYRALPPYPAVIRGRFDPESWAASSTRRADLYDATTDVPMPSDVTGFPGSAGVVEGVARVLARVEDGESFQEGEILVTTVTNIGWTPLFTRAAAVVTDVGAPLSHAAIVARELGIPAVVGCGNATTRITTGDVIQVDGTRGTVKRVR